VRFEFLPNGEAPRRGRAGQRAPSARITRPGGSKAFDDTVAGAGRITKDEFEAAYAVADGTLR
jgi:hypothetical protein